MDQFELARLKNEKRLERLARSQANQAPRDEEKVAVIEPPKEKPATAAIIEVSVTLPDRTIQFTLVKPSVYENVNPAKLTKNGILNCIQEGLKPLLGGVKEQ